LKLLTKLTLFITFSKLLIVVLFVLLLPSLVDYVSLRYSNYYLGQQKKKVLDVIDKNSIDYYLQGDSAYGSYTMLREEYISIVPSDPVKLADTIETSQRIIEGDTLNYRVLIHRLQTAGKSYVLEIGKTTATIGEYNLLLQRFTLFVLVGLIVLSIIIDLVYTNILLRPLAKIVRTRLLKNKFPFRDPMEPVKTSTTDFKYLDNSLISLMEQIHEAFDKEREFTSNASHELMTPISILQTNIENGLLDEELSESMVDRLSGMMKTVHRLKKIVHSLLYISRIENDQYVKVDTVRLHPLIEEVMEELSPKLELKSIQFENKTDSILEIKYVNHDLFFQLLYNLLNNAIRYNKEHGSIQISGQFLPGGSYGLMVKDTGIGIREEELANIFNRFKKSAQVEGEGYGLGLSIVKSIALFHGFEMKVESVYGEGTIFTVVIPGEMVRRGG
jgi:signal transduction histidine kinase